MMKEKIRDIFRRLGYLLLIVCGIGLVLALIGLVFKNDSLYFLGIILSSPLFLIVLPFCLLLVVLFELGTIYLVISSLFSALGLKRRSDGKRK
jgi:hypothetical protein